MTEFRRCCAALIKTQENKIILQKRDNFPYIAYPNYWALVGGPPFDQETPLDAICREILEELVNINGRPLLFSSITYVGSIEHQDKDRTEYLFFADLQTSTSLVKILEGQGYGVFTLEECIDLQKFAPHHKQILLYYKQKIQELIENNDGGSRKLPKGITLSEKKSIHDYVQITTFSKIKDYDAFERGINYVQVIDDNISALLHTEEKAAVIGHIEFLPNVPRGNHYHKRKVEYMVFLTGELKARYWFPDNPTEVFETILHSGDFVRILPGCAHTYTAIKEKVIAIEYSPQRYESADVFSVDE